MDRSGLRKARWVLVVAAGCFALTPAAFAQDEPVWKGTVTEITGPEDSVVVLRGTDAYALYPEDKLFAGDRVFTRTSGTARLTMDNCEIMLEPASFIEVTDQTCTVQITQLDTGAAFGGIPVLAAAAPLAETGAAIGLTPLLATAAGASAAAAAAAAGTGGGAEQNVIP